MAVVKRDAKRENMRYRKAQETAGYYVGEKIKGAVLSLRDEGRRLLDRADTIESAWEDWDVDYLISAGVISQRDADVLEHEIMEKERRENGY